jgi:hypothetical protein
MNIDFEELKKQLNASLNQFQGSYKLDEDNLAIPCTLKEYFELYGGDNRIDKRMFRDIIDDFTISTVFLGLDHSIYEDQSILFETMIFDDAYAGYVYEERCSTYEQAKEMHIKAVQLVRDGYNLEQQNPPSL